MQADAWNDETEQVIEMYLSGASVVMRQEYLVLQATLYAAASRPRSRSAYPRALQDQTRITPRTRDQVRAKKRRRGPPDSTADVVVCPICLDVLSNGSLDAPYACAHVFHEACIKKWSGSCPSCRTSSRTHG